MEIKVLGPLDVRNAGRPIQLTARKPRQVFALLAMYAGELVTVPTLVEELWGSEPPRSATQVVQTYILRLRQLIAETLPGDNADAAKEILATRPGGYLLSVPPDGVDTYRYQRLAAAGDRAVEAGDYLSATDLLGQALDVWRGPALVDVRVGSRLGVEVARLEQSRLCVLESRIEADLRLGRHHRLLGELAELTARYPMHEKLCTQYMTALYVSGCKWRALEVFRSLRRNLVDELGVEPSGEVQRIHLAILNSDGELRERVPRNPAALGAVG